MKKLTNNYEDLRDAIEALYEYVDRSNFNLNVVEVMLYELESYVISLKKCEKVEKNYNE